MPKPLDDDLLIAAARQGDESAFQRLMEHYQDYIFGLCTRVCRNRADAEEAAQETFLRFYQHLDRYHPGSKLSNWLYTIALNQCRQLLRRRKLRAMLSLDFRSEEQAAIQPLDRRASPEENAAQSQLKAQLARAAAALPAAQRELFALRYDLDLEISEIAAISGKSPEAVRIGLFRARNQVRTTLESLGLDVTAWGLGDKEEEEDA